ncbi:MAG: DUF5597 domain-containing protein [Verrucomicrobiota bacterium JB022]|nr:DUF5597 domain-containing protein [Verrucomicrobiota bacterium JB022]
MRLILRYLILLLPFVAVLRAELPRLETRAGAVRLIVDGQPFIARGGELGNSTGESGYLAQYWDKLEGMHVNFLLVPVYWDMVEPEEGRYDFSDLRKVIEEARARDIRLGLLWFASWKNSMSCYAPAWVKTDVERFPRALDENGIRQEIVSPFYEENWRTDAKAFAALMRELKSFDGQHHTVITVQVENEIGMIPSARDYSEAANRAYTANVPAEVIAMLQNRPELADGRVAVAWREQGSLTTGSWAQVFGANAETEEFFMAYYFAKYVEHVTKAGKDIYPLPMFVNAALIRAGYQPGQYPSAGPLPHLIELWELGAPSIDFFSPDIYFPNFVEWTRAYRRLGNPLFVPEALRTIDASVNGLYAFGEHQAMAFCPFGIESVDGQVERALRDSYDIVRQLTPLLAKTEPSQSRGLLKEAPTNTKPQEIRLGGYVFNASFERSTLPGPADGVIVHDNTGGYGAATYPAGGLMLQLGPDEFLFAGIGVVVTFDDLDPTTQVGILQCEEGRYENGEWQRIRLLNGDQTHQGRHLRLEPGRFTIQRIKLYRY